MLCYMKVARKNLIVGLRPVKVKVVNFLHLPKYRLTGPTTHFWDKQDLKLSMLVYMQAIKKIINILVSERFFGFSRSFDIQCSGLYSRKLKLSTFHKEKHIFK